MVGENIPLALNCHKAVMIFLSHLLESHDKDSLLLSHLRKWKPLSLRTVREIKELWILMFPFSDTVLEKYFTTSTSVNSKSRSRKWKQFINAVVKQNVL